jgi:hypothetical protein
MTTNAYAYAPREREPELSREQKLRELQMREAEIMERARRDPYYAQVAASEGLKELRLRMDRLLMDKHLASEPRFLVAPSATPQLNPLLLLTGETP